MIIIVITEIQGQATTSQILPRWLADTNNNREQARTALEACLSGYAEGILGAHTVAIKREEASSSIFVNGYLRFKATMHMLEEYTQSEQLFSKDWITIS